MATIKVQLVSWTDSAYCPKGSKTYLCIRILIIGLCLLITVIGSFVILNVTGGTMQRVSLASFILAMGMLVDNSIVIIDGILVDLGKGKPRKADYRHRGRMCFTWYLPGCF